MATTMTVTRADIDALGQKVQAFRTQLSAKEQALFDKLIQHAKESLVADVAGNGEGDDGPTDLNLFPWIQGMPAPLGMRLVQPVPVPGGALGASSTMPAGSDLREPGALARDRD